MTVGGLPASPPPRPPHGRSERLELSAEPGSVPAARRFVRRTLTAWDCDELEEAGTLLVSELVTNAVLHARTAFAVELVESDGSALLVVSDASPLLPVVRRHTRTAGTGRGLWLLDQYSLRHGVHVTDDGKQVWSELRAEEPSPDDAEEGSLALWLDEIESL